MALTTWTDATDICNSHGLDTEAYSSCSCDAALTGNISWPNSPHVLKIRNESIHYCLHPPEEEFW